jgi:hypothetical protein
LRKELSSLSIILLANTLYCANRFLKKRLQKKLIALSGSYVRLAMMCVLNRKRNRRRTFPSDDTLEEVRFSFTQPTSKSSRKLSEQKNVSLYRVPAKMIHGQNKFSSPPTLLLKHAVEMLLFVLQTYAAIILIPFQLL